MAGRIPTTRRVARAAARRATLASLLRGTGLGLSAGLVLALLVVGIDRIVPLAPLWLLIGVPGALGLAAGVAYGLTRAWSITRAAIEIDSALGLRDALSSALEFAAGRDGNDEAFVELATRDAERVAREVRVGRVVRVRPGAAWLAWPVLGALAVGIGLLVPRIERAPREAEAAEQVAERRAALADRVSEAKEAARQALESSAGDAATTEELTALEELERELTQAENDPDEIASRAAGELERVADRLEREADLARRETDALREQLAETQPQAEGPAAELAEALGSGDLAAARDAARRMLEQTPEMSEQERRELARELSEMADQLSRSGDPGAGEISEGGAEGLEQALREQDLDEESIQDIARQMDAEEAARQLEQEGVNPDVARKLGEQVADEARRHEARERAREQRERLDRALKSTAHDLDPENQPPPPPEPETPQDQPPAQPPTPPDEGPQPPQDEPPPPDQRQPDQQGPEQPGEQPPSQPSTPDQGQKQDQPQGESGQQKGEPGEQRQGEQKQQQGEGTEGQQPPQSQPGSDQPGATETQQQQPGQQTEPKGDQQQEGQGQEPGQKPGQQPGEQGPQQPGGEPTEQPGRGEQPSPGAQEGQEQPGQGAPTPGQEPGSQPGQQGDAQQPGAGEQPGGQQGEAQGTDSGRPGAAPQPGQGDRTGQLYRQLERMAERQAAGERSAEDAAAIRKRAQEMMDEASPEELEQMQRLADRLRRDAPPAPDAPPLEDRASELFDARPTGPETEPAPEQVIAQWYADQKPGEGRRVSDRVAGERMREAAAGAERAIEQQRVPRRHRDLLRRVFKRYAGEADRPAPVEDAKDAGGS